MKNEEGDWIELSPDPLDAGRAVAFVTDGAAGGIAIFLGTTRGEKSGGEGARRWIMRLTPRWRLGRCGSSRGGRGSGGRW